MTSGLDVQWLGRVEYEAALRLQMERVALRREQGCGDTLLLLEHPPVVTLGRSAHEENLLRSREELSAAGISGLWYGLTSLNAAVASPRSTQVVSQLSFATSTISSCTYWARLTEPATEDPALPS